ncbi:hypothetical protein AX774_g6410 [Zancudomyces culisetae]|uniref:Uncharacterized protein n=1 Tax=Zancudomyces culisetae TaxID=1213189 RepID=A0A1R1PGQ7_ZANCU|nr:hypothetical protein AX774_g6410 [Zancudomyces culisetae]|eukprot:OMH80160.1 hypothetical protein AX774_g6410 [Zancudomyces culisetae]
MAEGQSSNSNDIILKLATKHRITPDYHTYGIHKMLLRAVSELKPELIDTGIIGYKRTRFYEESDSSINADNVLAIKEICSDGKRSTTNYVLWKNTTPFINRSEGTMSCTYPIYQSKGSCYSFSRLVEDKFILLEFCIQDDIYVINHEYVNRTYEYIEKPSNKNCAYVLFAPVRVFG